MRSRLWHAGQAEHWCGESVAVVLLSLSIPRPGTMSDVEDAPPFSAEQLTWLDRLIEARRASAGGTGDPPQVDPPVSTTAPLTGEQGDGQVRIGACRQ